MEWISSHWLAALLQFCWEAPYQAPACRTVWMAVSATSIFVGVAGLFVLGYSALSYYLKHQAALRAQAAREVVDYEEIQKVRWQGDDPKVGA